jgi:M6 family metalloprotease-like protein
MRKVIALVSSLLLVVTFATPAQSAGAKYSVYQKTLATFSSSATTLTSQQKSQVKATVDANPTAEKFICTGIRYYDQPMSVNITVRKRAKAACEYANQLNPALSTWFQNKPTQARSYAGKVLLTVKTAQSPDVSNLSKLVSAPAECKLQENSVMRNRFGSDLAATSFPPNRGTLPLTGKIKVAFIPLAFSDTVELDDIDSYVGGNIKKFVDFYSTVSSNKLTIEPVVLSDWLISDGIEKDYWVASEHEGDASPKGISVRKKLLQEAVALADPLMDFAEVDVVIVALPSSQRVVELSLQSWSFDPSASVELRADGNKMLNSIATGMRFDKDARTPIWSHWAHEFAHMVHIPDLVLNANTKLFPEGDTFGYNPLSGYDIMSVQDGPIRTLNGWSRWVQGWLDDGEVTCINLEDISTDTFEISNLDIMNAGARILIIKISATEVYVVESRRWNSEFDTKVTRDWDGVIAYSVDSKLGHQEGPIKLLTNRKNYFWEEGSLNSQNIDATLHRGESFDSDILRISVETVQALKSIVTVSRP